MASTRPLLQVTLTDPGMYDRSFNANTWEEVQDRLVAYSQHYTRATVSSGSEVLGWAWRKLGEIQWETRKRP